MDRPNPLEDAPTRPYFYLSPSHFNLCGPSFFPYPLSFHILILSDSRRLQLWQSLGDQTIRTPSGKSETQNSYRWVGRGLISRFEVLRLPFNLVLSALTSISSLNERIKRCFQTRRARRTRKKKRNGKEKMEKRPGKEEGAFFICFESPPEIHIEHAGSHFLLPDN